jgi:glutamate dehydrogenase
MILAYGIIYCFGRGSLSFHVRFRDIARGGMRIILPASMEQYTVACRGLLVECYSLANAQQLKNKDIPEGGAKAVLLVEPGQSYAEAAACAFADGLLDLTCPEVDSSSKLVADYLGENEVYEHDGSLIRFYALFIDT